MWRLWAKALGEKHGRDNAEADTIAAIRTIIVLVYIITNLFIIAGILRHWNDGEKTTIREVDHGHNVSYSCPDSQLKR